MVSYRIQNRSEKSFFLSMHKNIAIINNKGSTSVPLRSNICFDVTSVTFAQIQCLPLKQGWLGFRIQECPGCHVTVIRLTLLLLGGIRNVWSSNEIDQNHSLSFPHLLIHYQVITLKRCQCLFTVSSYTFKRAQLYHFSLKVSCCN